MSWASILTAFRSALSGASVGLVELPSSSVETVASTLTVPGAVGYSVFIPESEWVNDRQRTRVRSSHSVTVDIVAMAKQHGNEHDTIASVLDYEESARSAVLASGAALGAVVQWTSAARAFSEDRVYLIARHTYAVTASDVV